MSGHLKIVCALAAGLILSASLTSATASVQPRGVARIAVVVMENKEYESLVRSRDAPFVNVLIRNYALATNFYALQHPSLPNYIALLGGDTFGISTNCDECTVSAPNLIDQIEAKGISWKAYIEGFPGGCSSDAEAGRYTKHHNPFMYFEDIRSNPVRCAKIVGLGQLTRDIRSQRLPRFVWITPDECHDMHDCTVSVGDAFLSNLIPPLLKALGPSGLLFLVWDEGDSDQGCCSVASGGHVVVIVAGGAARRGARLRTPTDHYAILRAIEDTWHLPKLGGAGCRCAGSLTSLFERTR